MSADSPNVNSDEMARFEAQLASLQPNRARLDREQLFYAAGVAAGEAMHAPRSVLGIGLGSPAWPAALGAMTTLSAVLALLLVGGQPVEPTSAPTSRMSTHVDNIARQLEPRDPTKLVAGDVYRYDEQHSLANETTTHSPPHSEAINTDPSPDTRALTPVAWEQVL